MEMELIDERDTLVVRRLRLQPGEAMFWHTDACERLTVVVHGSRLRIEFRDGERVEANVHPGLTGWDQPEARVHRAVNAGEDVYEEVVTFFRDSPAVEPQPQA